MFVVGLCVCIGSLHVQDSMEPIDAAGVVASDGHA